MAKPNIIKLEARERTEFGKGAARRARVAGDIPVVIYSKDLDAPKHVLVDSIEFHGVIRNYGVNAVLDLDIDDRAVDYARLPRVTFTGPAIGAVGMTEKDVVAAGIRCDCRVLPLHHVPRALVNRDTRGFVKIVVDADTGKILGITAVAKDAGELAAAGVHVLGKTVAEVADAWAPYLTMAEGIRIAAKAFTTDPSLLSCCA